MVNCLQGERCCFPVSPFSFSHLSSRVTHLPNSAVNAVRPCRSRTPLTAHSRTLLTHRAAISPFILQALMCTYLHRKSPPFERGAASPSAPPSLERSPPTWGPEEHSPAAAAGPAELSSPSLRMLDGFGSPTASLAASSPPQSMPLPGWDGRGWPEAAQSSSSPLVGASEATPMYEPLSGWPHLTAPSSPARTAAGSPRLIAALAEMEASVASYAERWATPGGDRLQVTARPHAYPINI